MCPESPARLILLALILLADGFVILQRGSDSGDAPPATSGANWPNEVLTPNGVLVPKALKYGKLLMAEEWVYQKNGDIRAQAHSLNALGIPWTYWDVMSGSESCSSCGNNEISVDGGSSSAFATLSTYLKEALNTKSVFDWSKYFTASSNAKAITDGTGGTSSSSCTWGCKGWSCSSSSPCQGDLECTNGVCEACTWGCLDWSCSASSPCKDVNQCVKGVCKPSPHRPVKERTNATMVSATLVHGGASAGRALYLVRARMSTSVLMVSVSLVRRIVKDGHAAPHRHVKERTNAITVSATLVRGAVSDGTVPFEVHAKATMSALMAWSSLADGVVWAGCSPSSPCKSGYKCENGLCV
ncbi:hypothetical protein V1508DRAFT_447999 [Lipomyces doorenjongii]|uniref:uncharacterized protein n=1 Tax=Lipomyces doorenjongii TaxID=383834 RepID=UPI0034CD7FC0